MVMEEAEGFRQSNKEMTMHAQRMLLAILDTKYTFNSGKLMICWELRSELSIFLLYDETLLEKESANVQSSNDQVGKCHRRSCLAADSRTKSLECIL